MSDETADTTVEPIENVLLKIVLAFRVLGWAWLLLLVIAAWFTDDTANKTILASMAIGTFIWTLFTLWVAQDQKRFKSPAFVIADGVVALMVASASYFAGAQSNLHGGYPISWIAVVAYAGDVRWALGAGLVLFLNQWIGMDIEGTRTVPDKAGAVVFLVYALILGYGFDIIRQRDGLRKKVEGELQAERQQQIRHAEQELLADQLHDSVLQTLHAIRVTPGDEEQVSYVARKQERELRRTIHSLRSEFTNPFVTAMYTARDDVEDLYRIEIDMVCSFDREMTVPLAGLVDATREAMINAAKHSGSEVVLVYCSQEQGHVTVFVRDRGSGFDQETASSGFGIENSIVRRLDAIGGTGTISSTSDLGTEVELTLPLEAIDP
ncbi:MAG: sensor histidine kinase [Acidimicrobiia bacterium]